MKENKTINPIGKYTMILIVEFDDGTTSHFLVEGLEDPDFDCDLQSDLWFNEFPEKKIKKSFFKNVNSLTEVIEFMKEHHYEYEKHYYDNILHIGGEHDMNLYEDLSFEWMND